MRVRTFVLFISAAILTAIILPACAPTFAEQYPEVMSKYKTMPRQKALAVAVDPNGAHAYGYGSNYDTSEKAEQRALAECEAQRKVDNVKKPCSIYMINDQKVEE